jgi:hypothetical protein
VVRRIVSARETLSLRKELKSTGYNLKCPASSITGEKNQDIRMFTSFLMQPDITLEHLTTAFDVRYLTQTNDTSLGQESFEALYFLKLDHTETPSISKILKQKMKHPDVYQEQLARMMFLINKKAYLELFRQISLPGMVEVKKRSSEFEELYLLQIIALLADIQEKQPLLAKESEELNEMALSMLTGVRKPAEALKTIKKPTARCSIQRIFTGRPCPARPEDRVPLLRPRHPEPGRQDPGGRQAQKLRGSCQAEQKTLLKNLTVVVQAKKEG